MKIRIFLSSSTSEFSKERESLMAFTQALNNIYHDRDIFLETIICETLSNQFLDKRTQTIYNQIAQESEYFYVIFGKRAGEFTIEEFDAALEAYRNKGTPHIYAFFHMLPDGQQPEKSVLDFMKRMDVELQHYYSTFTHIDSIKLNILMEICRDPRLKGTLTLEDGQAMLNGIALLSMDNVPLYNKNKSLQTLRKEKEDLEQEFIDITELGNSDKIQRLLMKNIARRNEIASSIHEIEKNMLGLCRQIEDNRRLGKHLNWREKKAIELVDNGDYDSAKAVLRDDQWQTEIEHAKEIITEAKETILEYISGKKTLIQTIKTTGIDKKAESEILTIYEDICALALNNQAEIEVLYDYADFLLEQNRFVRGIQIAEKLSHLYAITNASEDRQADVEWMLGRLYHWENDLAKAETSFRKSLQIRCNLTNKNSSVYEADLAKSCNNLANVLFDTKQFEEAETLFREALQYRRHLASQDPATHEPDLARTCNNLGNLLSSLHSYKESEALHKEALEIRRRLAAKDHDLYEGELARSCYSLGNLYLATEQYEKSEKLHGEAYEIRCSLAQKNPAAYDPDLARSCFSLGILYENLGQTEKAETFLRKSLEIRTRLANQNPTAFEPELTFSHQQLANLLSSIRDPSQVTSAPPVESLIL